MPAFTRHPLALATQAVALAELATGRFRLGIGTGNQGGGKDDLAGYNVHTIALQVPKSDVTRICM